MKRLDIMIFAVLVVLLTMNIRAQDPDIWGPEISESGTGRFLQEVSWRTGIPIALMTGKREKIEKFSFRIIDGESVESIADRIRNRITVGSDGYKVQLVNGIIVVSDVNLDQRLTDFMQLEVSGTSVNGGSTDTFVKKLLNLKPAEEFLCRNRLEYKGWDPGIKFPTFASDATLRFDTSTVREVFDGIIGDKGSGVRFWMVVLEVGDSGKSYLRIGIA